MKRLLLPLLLAACATCALAQTDVRYGYLSRKALLESLPEYTYAVQQVADLRKKYADEAQYNETTFRRQFAEFLQGQKDFPQSILLKRQRDLQDAMEKSLAFRHEADSLLREAEHDIMQPLRNRVDEAVKAVGMERGYEYILDTDSGAYPFIHPRVGENAEPYVKEKLGLSVPEN